MGVEVQVQGLGALNEDSTVCQERGPVGEFIHWGQERWGE